MRRSGEQTVLDSLPSLWRVLTPWMDSFVQDAWRHFVSECFPDPIRSHGRAVDVAVVNELAFAISELAWGEGEHPRAIVYAHPSYPQLESDAISRIRSLSGGGEAELPEDAVDEALRIAIRLTWILRNRVLASAEEQLHLAFRPSFAGCGFLGPVEADIMAGGLLVEVKAGQRSVQGRDCRQLLLYAALGCEEGHDLHSVCWINPRRGGVLRLSIEEMSYRVSGHSWFELRSGILSALGLTVSR